MSVARLFSLVFAVVWVLTGALESAAPDELVLAWTKAKVGQQHFDEGKALFEKGDWKAAYQSFKAARKLAKGRFTKTEVERWQIGSQGGLELETLEKVVLTGNKKRVYRLAEQKLTRDQALHGFTLGAAYAAFQEHSLGSLEPGKRADFVILSQDIMRIAPAQILNTAVVATYLDGQPVYQKPR